MTRNADKTHYLHGHPFDEANTRWTKRGYRDCRSCALDREARRAVDPVYRERSERKTGSDLSI